mmetsp:Transcript_32721/g.43628  ORF Transcript_32721/g.43628 Transcript_32721/m.43628 type:complete len:81 (+) Transcript_32721:354-596(+)
MKSAYFLVLKLCAKLNIFELKNHWRHFPCIHYTCLESVYHLHKRYNPLIEEYSNQVLLIFFDANTHMACMVYREAFSELC